MINYFKSWDFMRILRLVIGIFAAAQAIYTMDIILGIAAFVIGGMAIFNIGCCGVNGCNTNYKSSKKQNQDVEFEEVVAEK